MLTRRLASAAALTLLGACAGPDKPAPLPLGAGGSSGAPLDKLPLAVKAALDSGNTALRADDYAQAVAQYTLAVRGAPAHPAPWFGLYMAAKELPDSALADSAMRQMRRLTSDSLVLPAHDEVAAVAMPSHGATTTPAGHPATARDGGPVRDRP